MEELRPGDPRRAGRYELMARLGSGGMGDVFLGRSPGGRPVAVKVIKAELLAGHPDFRARFAREVAAARRVNALFTAPVVDADPDAETPWLVTAYVPGPSLDDAVGEYGPMPGHAVLALAAGLAEGLAAIHAAGVVHRDLKPSNVLLASDGPRIIDFGIARAAEASALTATGAFVGTPAFMCPEQAEGKPAGSAGDIFSLGSVLTFAATGRSPFAADSVPGLFYQVVTAEPDLSAVPAQLRPVIGRCLAKDPARRPAASDLVGELAPAAPSPDWLPQPVAATLHRYQVPGQATVTPPPGAPVITQPAQRAPAAQPRVPSPRGPVRPAVRPAAAQPGPRAYLPPPPGPAWPAASVRAGRTGRLGQAGWLPAAPRAAGGGPLPPEYRFGWLSLPLLLLVATAAFVAPLETFYLLTYGVLVVIVVSRGAAAAAWIRARGPAGLVTGALRAVLADLGGLAGLALLGFAALAVTVYVLLPSLNVGPGGDYAKALQTSGPADPFATARQAAYFLHLFFVLPAFAATAVVLLRSRANLSRPLLLPRTARLLNASGAVTRRTVAAAAVALAALLIALNGGVSPARLPSGAICSVARATCAAASRLYQPG